MATLLTDRKISRDTELVRRLINYLYGARTSYRPLTVSLYQLLLGVKDAAIGALLP